MADEVKIYEEQEVLPVPNDTLGLVCISDGGFAVNCSYEQVLLLAQQQTAKVGGNALKITTHLKPNALGSSCHRIWADMMYIEEGAAIPETRRISPFQPADSPEPVSSGFTKSVSDTVPDPLPVGVLPAQPEYDPHSRQALTHRQQRKQVPQHTFYGNVGYGYILSKFYLPPGWSDAKSGIGYNAGYQWTGKSGLGIGIVYSGLATSSKFSEEEIDFTTQYIGPEFVSKSKIGVNGILSATLGVGYGWHSQAYQSEHFSTDGFGVHLSVGAEYMIGKHVGIGANLLWNRLFFPEFNGYWNEDEKGGISHIGISAGIRVYFGKSAK